MEERHAGGRWRELLGDRHFIHSLARVAHYPRVEAPEQVLEAWQVFMAASTAT